MEALTRGNSFRPSTTARQKKLISPRPMPWAFSNFSLYLPRISWRLNRSTSLKVVRRAAVCWAWTRRSAIFLRILLIGTRLTPLASKLPAAGVWLEEEAGTAPWDGEAALGEGAAVPGRRGIAIEG